MQTKEKEVIHTAISLLQKDVEEVFGGRLEITEDPDRATIVVGDLPEKEGCWETFSLSTEEKKGKRQLIIRGSDARGKPTAFLRSIASDRGVAMGLFCRCPADKARAIYLSGCACSAVAFGTLSRHILER